MSKRSLGLLNLALDGPVVLTTESASRGSDTESDAPLLPEDLEFLKYNGFPWCEFSQPQAQLTAERKCHQWLTAETTSVSASQPSRHNKTFEYDQPSTRKRTSERFISPKQNNAPPLHLNSQIDNWRVAKCRQLISQKCRTNYRSLPKNVVKFSHAIVSSQPTISHPTQKTHTKISTHQKIPRSACHHQKSSLRSAVKRTGSTNKCADKIIRPSLQKPTSKEALQSATTVQTAKCPSVTHTADPAYCPEIAGHRTPVSHKPGALVDYTPSSMDTEDCSETEGQRPLETMNLFPQERALPAAQIKGPNPSSRRCLFRDKQVSSEEGKSVVLVDKPLSLRTDIVEDTDFNAPLFIGVHTDGENTFVNEDQSHIFDTWMEPPSPRSNGASDPLLQDATPEAESDFLDHPPLHEDNALFSAEVPDVILEAATTVLDLPSMDEVPCAATAAATQEESAVTLHNIQEDKKKRKQIQKPASANGKRTRDVSKWISNIAKVAHHSGKEYTNRVGKKIPAKIMRESCGKACLFGCYLRVTEEDRKNIFNAYYKLPNADSKWSYIRLLVDSVSPKKRKNTENPMKSCSRTYHFFLNKKKVRVCQTMFLSTLSISDFVVRTAFKKLGQDGTISPDKRGGIRDGVAVPENITKSIDDHIASFPRVASHYCRKSSTCEYLEAQVKCKTNMFNQYVELMTSKGIPKKLQATYRQYTDRFNQKNIKFFQPRKDQCDTCFSWDHNSEQKTDEEIQAHESHILKKDLAQALKEKDRETVAKSPDIAVCAYDLQKVLLLPKCEAGALYYKRKLSVYNFTIYDMGRHHGHCYVWHEGIGKRGANEIASYVFNFIGKMVEKGVKLFIFYSDNCAGQNKNRYVFAMYLLAACKYKVRIEHRFLQTGHTQNEADTMHSLIERKSRNQELYLPEHWCRIMEGAKATGNPYTVNRITQNDILNFHPLVDTYSSWPNSVNWTEINEICADGSCPWQLELKYDLGDEPTKINVRPLQVGRPLQLQKYNPPKAYNAPLPITDAKKKDFVDFCEKSKIVPGPYRQFFTSFVARGDAREDYYAK